MLWEIAAQTVPRVHKSQREMNVLKQLRNFTTTARFEKKSTWKVIVQLVAFTEIKTKGAILIPLLMTQGKP